ncbi:MAG TPA: hypothetical protein PLV68_05090, partial [Ilumatobacteraceae bacterium]|nr:hypothetical protein [Ilumatobacteraceae bacterium]
EPFGPAIVVDGAVRWTYAVTNTGNVHLADVTVVDDQGVVISCGVADADQDGDIDLLAPGAVVTCVGNGISESGQYENLATVQGTPADPDGTPLVDGDGDPLDKPTDDDPSHYFGADPGISIVKYTNGEDADTPTGPFVLTNRTVTWTFEVTNTGNTALLAATVTDDKVPAAAINCGDGSNVIALMLPGDVVTCTATGIAIAGQYANLGSVTAAPALPAFDDGIDPDDPDTWPSDPDDYEPIEYTDVDGGTTTAPPVTDDDPSHYYGMNPAIDLVKEVCLIADQNGCDPANNAHWGKFVVVTSGTLAHYRITVTNTGSVDLAPVDITDPAVPNCATTIASLAIGASHRYTCTLDPVPGALHNVATAVGNPVDKDGEDIIDPDTHQPIP